MARKGSTISNSITGEQITWIETASDTNGARLVCDFSVRAGGKLPVTHLHPQQSERFEMSSGRFWIERKGEVNVMGPGDTITIAQGEPHTWWNEGAETAHMRVTFTPALNTETFLEQFFGLCNDGRAKADGTPAFLQIMAMANRFQIYVAGPPIIVQKCLSFVLGGIARMLGYKSFYPEYSAEH